MTEERREDPAAQARPAEGRTAEDPRADPQQQHGTSPQERPGRLPYDVVVFDWDGTLADSAAIIAQAIRNACRDLRLTVPDDAAARYVIGLGLADALAHVAPDLPVERHPELAARYREHYLAKDPDIPLFEGARELLEGLRLRGHRLAVATGKSRVGLDRALRQSGLAPLFAATRCADEGRPKPHPDMLLHLMERLDVRPERTLMIGDTTHDLDLAANAGVDCVAVAYGAHHREAFHKHRPVAVVGSIEDLTAWLFPGTNATQAITMAR